MQKLRSIIVASALMALAFIGVNSQAQVGLPPCPTCPPPCTNCPPWTPPPPDTRRNAVKFMDQRFSLIDTNYASLSDTNLYAACVAFGQNTNTVPTLQVKPYGADGLLLMASHFDFSQDSRDWTLAVCDKVQTPLMKSIDFLGASDAQDGWLVQGTVANYLVTDPMFLLVTNLQTDCPVFFRAIPYSGPQVNLTGAQPGDTVSNIMTLNASIIDLSGVTNEQFSMFVDDLPARYHFGTNGNFTIETPYNPNGPCTVYLYAGNVAGIFDPTNPPTDAKLFFSGKGTLPLDFENPTYLAFQGDNTSPDVVPTNYIMFSVNQAQNISATINDPSNGVVVARYSGYMPSAGIVELPWNFTEANGVTPYSNSTYVVNFTPGVNGIPPNIIITNTIFKNKVRGAAIAMTCYSDEDPADPTGVGPALNGEASKWLGALAFAYENLYFNDFASQTAFYPGQIDTGNNRDAPVGAFPLEMTGANQGTFFSGVSLWLKQLAISDWDWVGHGRGSELGGSSSGYISNGISNFQLGAAVGKTGMRKAAIWACYSDTPPWGIGGLGSGYPTTAAALGISSTAQEKTCWMAKNVGLFFTGKLSATGYQNTFGGSVNEVAADFDELWIAGPPGMIPGAADPTWSFQWAVTQIAQQCPELISAQMVYTGFQYLPYSGAYDIELSTNNLSHVNY